MQILILERCWWKHGHKKLLVITDYWKIIKVYFSFISIFKQILHVHRRICTNKIRRSDPCYYFFYGYIYIPVRTSATALLPQIVLAQYFAFNYVTVKDQYWYIEYCKKRKTSGICFYCITTNFWFGEMF